MPVETIVEGDALRPTQTKLINNFDCLNSNNAGTSSPSSAVTGTVVYRTDLNAYRLTDTTLDDTYTSSPTYFGFTQYQTVIVSEADLTEAGSGTPQTINLISLPANSVVVYARAKTSTAFSGGSISAITLTVGDTGSATRYLGSYDLFAAVSDTNLSQNAAITPWDNAATFNVQGTFNPTGDSLANLTAGAVAITIGFIVIPS